MLRLLHMITFIIILLIGWVIYAVVRELLKSVFLDIYHKQRRQEIKENYLWYLEHGEQPKPKKEISFLRPFKW